MRNLVIYFFLAFLTFACSNELRAQTDKDDKKYEELEREVRKNFDKRIAKFKSLHSLPQAKTKSSPLRLAIESSYDKFKDVTTVAIVTPVEDLNGTVNSRLRGYIAMVDVFATYSYLGQQPVKPSSLNLVFKTFASSPLFGPNPSFIVIGNDKRYRLGNMSQSVRHVSAKSVEEYVSISVPYEVFFEFANADDLEVQIGNIDFPLSELNLNGFRMITGLPAKPIRQITDIPDSVSNKQENSREENSAWAGQFVEGALANDSPLAFELKSDGNMLVQTGPMGERSGTWRQDGDRVRFFLPPVAKYGFATQFFAVGIITGNRMVLRFTYSGLLNSPKWDAVVDKIP